MTDDELIEELAQAMRKAYNEHLGKDIVPWDEANPEPRAGWLAAANGCIDIIRKIETEATLRELHRCAHVVATFKPAIQLSIIDNLGSAACALFWGAQEN
jgi:hypothetical protein